MVLRPLYLGVRMRQGGFGALESGGGFLQSLQRPGFQFVQTRCTAVRLLGVLTFGLPALHFREGLQIIGFSVVAGMTVQSGENLVFLDGGADAEAALANNPLDERSDTAGSVFVERDTGGDLNAFTQLGRCNRGGTDPRQFDGFSAEDDFV